MTTDPAFDTLIKNIRVVRPFHSEITLQDVAIADGKFVRNGTRHRRR